MLIFGAEGSWQPKSKHPEALCSGSSSYQFIHNAIGSYNFNIATVVWVHTLVTVGCGVTLLYNKRLSSSSSCLFNDNIFYYSSSNIALLIFLKEHLLRSTYRFLNLASSNLSSLVILPNYHSTRVKTKVAFYHSLAVLKMLVIKVT